MLHLVRFAGTEAALRFGGRAVSALLGAILIAACGTLPAPGQASPEVVLNSYLVALQAGKCEQARAYATPSFVVGNGDLCGALDVLAFGPLTGPATPQDGEVIFSTTLTTSGDGASIPAGDSLWFYSLVRQPDGSWRIVGGGSGP